MVLRTQESQGFILLKKRWVVEGIFGWWNWYRRCPQDYEYLPQNSEPMIYIAIIRPMVRHLV